MVMDINSKWACEELECRVLRTLSGSGFNTNKVKTKPCEFRSDDIYIFRGLCKAVLSRQTNWDKVVGVLPIIAEVLCNYDIEKVASLSDKEIDKRYKEKLEGKTEVSFLRRKLKHCRKNAEVFQDIRQQHSSVWQFIKGYLNENEYDKSKKCYIQPNDDNLIKCFIEARSPFKLSGVRLAICCEFFNNIGIDEFKPDEHAIIVLVSIGAVGRRSKSPEDIREEGAVNKESPKEIRQIGIKIAETLGKPRKYVDSLLWNFGRRICTKGSPTCNSCRLKIEEPAFCEGIPDWDGFLKAVIVKDPFGTAEVMKRHGFTRNEARKEMEKAGLEPDEIEEILRKVYGP